MDMKVGPDGAIYLIEWGTGFYGANSDAKIVRMDYRGGGVEPPVTLESAAELGLPFTADSAARFDSTGKTISIPLPPATGFYRLASRAPVLITGVRLTTEALILSYELGPAPGQEGISQSKPAPP